MAARFQDRSGVAAIFETGVCPAANECQFHAAAGTVEERIVELQDKKGRLAAATLDARGAVGSLAAEDLDYLFGE